MPPGYLNSVASGASAGARNAAPEGGRASMSELRAEMQRNKAARDAKLAADAKLPDGAQQIYEAHMRDLGLSPDIKAPGNRRATVPELRAEYQRNRAMREAGAAKKAGYMATEPHRSPMQTRALRSAPAAGERTAQAIEATVPPEARAEQRQPTYAEKVQSALAAAKDFQNKLEMRAVMSQAQAIGDQVQKEAALNEALQRAPFGAGYLNTIRR